MQPLTSDDANSRRGSTRRHASADARHTSHRGPSIGDRPSSVHRTIQLPEEALRPPGMVHTRQAEEAVVVVAHTPLVAERHRLLGRVPA